MSPAARLLRLVVLAYRCALSPLLGPRCRFAPTCSAYALEALAVHGALRGCWLAVRRVARCHPFHPGGHDPVPPAGAPPAGAPVAGAPVAGAPATGSPAAARRLSDDGRSTLRTVGPAAGVPPCNACRPPSTARRLGAPS